jgi:hypothetical protein
VTDFITSAADQRIAKGVTSSLRWTCVDEYGEEVAAAGAVTVTVTRSAGTAVVTNAAASLEAGTIGTYLVALTPAQVGDLDVLTAVWKDSGTEVATTTAEVVGRFYFTVAELRASHPAFATNVQTWTSAVLARYRTMAEWEAEYICDRAFVPRFRQVTVEGASEAALYLPDTEPRALLGVTVDGVAYGSTELALLNLYADGRLLAALGSVWPAGQENVVVRYSHGFDVPPLPIKEAAMTRAREMALAGGPQGTAIPARATSMTTDGTTVQLTTASKYRTPNPDVNAVYSRWSRRNLDEAGASTGTPGGTRLAPASRAINFDPASGSLFHWGAR